MSVKDKTVTSVPTTPADPRAAYKGEMIVAKGRTIQTDTRSSEAFNANMLGLGPSGAGKTRHIVKPNLLQMGSSFVVLDTKGLLHREIGPVLKRHGYEVQNLNFADLPSRRPTTWDTTRLRSFALRSGTAAVCQTGKTSSRLPQRSALRI